MTIGLFGDVMSLPCSFCLWQFCPPLLSFFRFVPGFVEYNQVVQRLYCMWVGVAEFETVVFEGFNSLVSDKKVHLYIIGEHELPIEYDQKQ